MSQLKTGTVLSYLSLLLNTGISLVYTPYMLRMMGKSEFGLYSLVASIVTYLTILDFGFNAAIVRYTARMRAEGKEKEQQSLFGMFFVIYSGIGLLALLVGFVLYGRLDSIFGSAMSENELNRASFMYLLMVGNVALTFPLSVFGAILTAYEIFIFQKAITLIRIILNPLIIVILLFFGYKAIGLVVCTIAFNLITQICNAAYCIFRLKVKVRFSGFDLRLLREIGSFSFFVFLKSVLDQLYWQTGNIVLGAVSGPAAVSVYAVAMRLRFYFQQISGAMSGLFLPKLTIMATTGTQNPEISKLFIKVGRLQCHIVAPILIGFIVFGAPFVRLWAGPSFADAYWMALIIFIPFSIPLIQLLGHPLIQATDNQKFQFVIYLLMAIVTVVLSIPFAQLWGGVGCALAIAIAMIIGEILIMNWFYKYKLGIDIVLFWKEIGKMLLPMSTASVLFYYVSFDSDINSFRALFTQGLYFSLFYCPLIFFFGLNQYEKGLLIEGKEACKKLGKAAFLKMSKAVQ